MPDPLSDIENRKANNDLGSLALQVYRGALQEGATVFEAWLVTCAMFVGIMHTKPSQEEDDETPS